MNWKNLKDMKCPKCGLPLEQSNFNTRGYGCDSETCDFFITDPKFRQLVDGLYKGFADKNYKPKFGDDTEALRELNNL